MAEARLFAYSCSIPSPMYQYMEEELPWQKHANEHIATIPPRVPQGVGGTLGRILQLHMLLN